ncbi:MAG TPA: hypothetical protein HPP58_08175 [Deltaproteobacteria bacterium]|nr:hypothetical protein [Desulfobulbaceae bacterium]HIJ21009.1 hypothetical protein [Deltaproteobacteria bacterium]HIJ35681.1 hypothetical protein [Deltaproteobacteria bacterium]HIJ41465.1 hypothetical protein [Deltaproteobacteria bacterium]HIJ41926.1 hypothetical protein [Deltaproteobacteria bacterium]
MNSEELSQLMKQVEEKGMDWAEVEAKTKTPRQVLNLYLNSGPVPVTIINNLKKLLEAPAA